MTILESPRSVMRGGAFASPEFIVKANETFDAALDRVRYAAETMLDRLTSLTQPPDEVAVEFGVKLNAETGAVIAKASTEANFKINLKWTRASSNGPGPRSKGVAMLRHYDDFELVIQTSGETYIVQLLNSPAGQASGQFIPPFTQVELTNFYGRIGQMRRSTRRIDSPDLEAAKKFGNQLFHAVFTGELLGQLRTSMDRCHEHGRGLRIRLRLKGVPALAELPWEFLYDLEQDHFLATSTLTPMVRYLDLPQSVPTLRVKPAPSRPCRTLRPAQSRQS